jgi:hypothetical protein
MKRASIRDLHIRTSGSPRRFDQNDRAIRSVTHHFGCAIDIGETEIWTNDRHLLAAANHFGVAGRSV